MEQVLGLFVLGVDAINHVIELTDVIFLLGLLVIADFMMSFAFFNE